MPAQRHGVRGEGEHKSRGEGCGGGRSGGGGSAYLGSGEVLIAEVRDAMLEQVSPGVLGGRGGLAAGSRLIHLGGLPLVAEELALRTGMARAMKGDSIRAGRVRVFDLEGGAPSP